MTDTTTAETAKRKPAFIAHVVRDADGKGYWNRIGAAWANKGGKGYVLQLDAVPLDGRVVLMPPANN